MHVFDTYEDAEAPWQMCHEHCRKGPVDSWSGSLISRAMPNFYGKTPTGTSGFIIAPDAQIL